MIVVADDWQPLRQTCEELQEAISRSKATKVNAQSLRGKAREVVQLYFRSARPELSSLGISESDLSPLDLEMHGLLSLSNASNRKSSYLTLLRKLRPVLDSLEVAREMRLGQSSGSRSALAGDLERRILMTLEGMVPSAALSYEQALRDLADSSRVSYRGTANELREALRESLDHMAPDVTVEGSDGFKLEKGHTKPTQKQKVRHILSSRGLNRTARKAPESSALLVDELTATVTRASFDHGNLSAHISSSKNEVRRMKGYVDGVLADLLEIHET